MAMFLKGYHAYGPRVVHNRTVDTAELAAGLAGRTGIKRGQVLMVLRELHEVLVEHLLAGSPVHLEGIGRFGTAIDRAGRLRVTFLVEGELADGVNRLADYRGLIRNRANIGLDVAAYKALWDAEHPDDPLEFPTFINAAPLHATDAGATHATVTNAVSISMPSGLPATAVDGSSREPVGPTIGVTRSLTTDSTHVPAHAPTNGPTNGARNLAGTGPEQDVADHSLSNGTDDASVATTPSTSPHRAGGAHGRRPTRRK